MVNGPVGITLVSVEVGDDRGDGPGRRVAAAGLAAGAPALGAGAGIGPVKVTNDTQRIVECVLLVNGATHTDLAVHPDKAYWDDFTSGRILQLVCMRGREMSYGPLKLGVDYRFVDGPRGKVALAGEQNEAGIANPGNAPRQ